MANKFAKSVAERQKKELTQNEVETGVAQNEGMIQKESEMQTTVAAVATVLEKSSIQALSLKPEPITGEKELDVAVDLSKYLSREKERRAKNKTFYLDEEVIASIRTQAKKQKVTESRLVNDILSTVLGL